MSSRYNFDASFFSASPSIPLEFAVSAEDNIRITLISDAPVCRNKEAIVVGTSLGDIVNVVCSVDADPTVTTFKWVLNNSVQSLIVPAEKYVVLNATTSILGYKLISNRDFGTLTCQTSNAIGVQRAPCTFFVVKAGQYQ